MVEGRLHRLARIGRDHLAEDPMRALRVLVNPSRLTADPRTPDSRQTVYQAFKDRVRTGAPSVAGGPPWEVYWAWHRAGRRPGDAAVLASVISAMDLGWGVRSGNEGIVALSEDDQHHDGGPRHRLAAALRAHIDAVYEMPGFPVGWLVHAAALTASPRWRPGSQVLAGQDRDLGQAILGARRRQYEEMSKVLRPFLDHAMRELQRELEPDGPSSAEVLALMHALMDGALLRMTLDDELDPELVAEAMVRLGEAFSRRGSQQDPGRPRDAGALEEYNRVVAQASTTWATPDAVLAGYPSLDLDGIPRSAVDAHFVDAKALGDAVLWRRVSTIEPVAALAPRSQSMMLERGIQRLQAAAADLPDIVRALRDEGGAGSTFFPAFVASAAEAVRCLAPSSNADRAAEALVEAACGGGGGQDTIDAIAASLALFEPAIPARPPASPQAGIRPV